MSTGSGHSAGREELWPGKTRRHTVPPNGPSPNSVHTADTFNFTNWFRAAHLSMSTVQVLEGHNMNTREALSRATTDTLNALPIMASQRGPLLKAIDNLRPRVEFSTSVPSQKTSHSHGDGVDSEVSSICSDTVGPPTKYLTITSLTESVMEMPRRSKGPVTGDTKFERLLRDLGLSDHFPMMISIRDVMVVQSIHRSVALRITEVPIVMLKRLIMADYRGRDMVDYSERTDEVSLEAGSSCFEDAMAHLDMDEHTTENLHPQDVFNVCLSCCDLITRQILYEKMFLCKLALPLVYPHNPEGSLLFCMWALRGIVLEWKGRGGVSMESSLVAARFMNACFVRVGRPHISKSKLLNDVLRDDGHNTFFHRDCAHGMSDRHVADGMIETAVYLPSGREADFCEKVCMLCNLRGDASKFKVQTKFLKATASLILVIVDIEDITNNLSTLSSLLDDPNSSVCLLTARRCPVPVDKYKASLQKLYSCLVSKNGGKVNLVVAFDRQRTLNAVDLKQKVRKCIVKRLDEGGQQATTDLLQIRQNAIDSSMIIDESLQECDRGLQLAMKVYDVTRKLPITKVKSQLLQLQGDHWLKWSQLLKAKHRVKLKGDESSSIDRIDKINTEMNKLRHQQALICQSPSPLMSVLLDCMSKDSLEVLLFAMRWLKLLLDDKCREILPALYKKYHDQWNSLRKVKAKSTPDRRQLQMLTDGVEHAEKELQRSSLGLEHLYREMGQMYEACVEGAVQLTEDLEARVKLLPEVATRLLLDGHTMEVMDGEAANIPVTWATAVLTKAMDLVGGNKRVFILSVLGVQSSGKSTLLNTMFGMQFAVSAGRCTRGVYTQLVPVAKDSGLPFDYIFVDDTEGLRAPELAQTHNHDHDNELATLAIGLGDVTIVVIKGENYSELQDVLQIVVHAFLRMKIVNRNLNLNKRCVFIHQNVSAAAAEEKMMQARKKLQDTLDKMTIEAAQLEDRNDIKAFSDVIHFDCESDIWYFSGLWNGDPPMASVNPGYSENVAKVYQHIINNIAGKQKQFSLLSDIADRVKDLWNGILTEDFVFSFRNCLEVRAYNVLEMQYYKVYWELEKGIMTWVREEAGKKITLCESDKQLSSCCVELRNALARTISDKEKEAYKNMGHFFETHELRDKFIMWRQYKMNALKHAATDFSDRAKKELGRREKRRQLELLHESKNLKNEDEILKWAEEVASSQQGSKFTEKQIREKFDMIWPQFLSQYGLSVSKTDCNIPALVEKALWDVFYDNRPLLSEQIRNNKLKTPFKSESVVNSIPINEITKHHISIPPQEGEWERDQEIGWQKIQQHALNTINEVMRHVELYLRDLAQNDEGFKEDSPSYVIQIVLAELRRHNDQPNKAFTFLSNFKVKLAVHCCQFAIMRFNDMNDEYEARHGPAATLMLYKDKAFNLFKNTVDQRGGDVVIADLITQSLRGMITKTVDEALPQAIVTDVVVFFNTKFHLILALLDDLASKKSFLSYKSYLYNPKEFAKSWIRSFTDNHYFTPSGLQSATKYACIAQAVVHRICECVKHSIIGACQDPRLSSNPNMVTWNQIFCTLVQRELAIPASSLRHIEMRSLTSIGELKRHLLSRVQLLEEEITHEFCEVTANTVRWQGESPYDQIIHKLWGCRAECPFCGEVCQLTDPNHIQERTPHRCIQHRPSGVIGWHRSTGELNFETCSYRITQNWQFRCGRETCGQRFRECSRSEDKKVYHPYKEYKRYISDWEIVPSPTMDSSDYWTWFMSTFLTELVDHYDTLSPDIPPSWRNITLQQARDSLRKTYM